MTRRTLWRPIAVAMLLLAAVLTLGATTRATARQDATPSPYSCDATMPMAGTPMPGMGMDMGTPMPGMGMEMGTPMAGMTAEPELDQLYIDMMIPHHASIAALSQAALPRLTDPRLKTIAEAIIGAQTAEIAELRGYREQRYGGPDPMPMDAPMMEMMMGAMPGMGSMDEMMSQMDAATQVATFCAAEDADLAFIDLVIPHHEMAIVSSETARDQAIHPEIRDFAGRVIDAQRREIDELTAIRAELTGASTPTS